MARHTTITDDQILDAARAVFLEEGFRAQTAKVARLAGVSEGTIFKRFETKERLFHAALEIPYPPPWYQHLEQLAGTGEVRENLVTIGVEMLTFFQQTIPRMLAAAGVKLPTLGLPPPDEDMNKMISNDLDKICAYLETEQSLGRVSQADTRILAAMLLGCFANPVLRSTGHRAEQNAAELRQSAEKMIDILWSGLKPE